MGEIGVQIPLGREPPAGMPGAFAFAGQLKWHGRWHDRKKQLETKHFIHITDYFQSSVYA